MKNLLMILLVILLSGGIVVAAAGENNYFFPMIFDSSKEPYTGEGYTWVYIGAADVIDGAVKVLGQKPGYCYDVVVHDIQDDKTAVLIAKEIQDGALWCTAPPYNPDAPWPPPQFAPPTEIPPDIFYGHIFSMVIPRTVKKVCGYGGQTNCVVVRR